MGHTLTALGCAAHVWHITIATEPHDAATTDNPASRQPIDIHPNRAENVTLHRARWYPDAHELIFANGFSSHEKRQWGPYPAKLSNDHYEREPPSDLVLPPTQVN